MFGTYETHSAKSDWGLDFGSFQHGTELLTMASSTIQRINLLD